MDQDKEFLQWIMQDNPLDDVDTAYRHPQPPASQQQQQYPSYPPSTMPQLSHPPHQQKHPNYSEQQRLYDERFSHQQSHSNGSNVTAQLQQVGPVAPPPPQTYLPNGAAASPPQQQMHQQQQQMHQQQQQQQQQQHHHHQQHQQQNNHQTYYAHHQYHHPYDQHQQQTNEAKSIPEARLSDEDEEHYTDAQLKMMTSKERRQLRNKISARNFRNRRKEYIASLEGEVAKFKNENSQLRLEIKWVRTTMNKLQKENDHLRVKLALCHGGIKTGEESVSPDQPTQEAQQQQLQQSMSSPSNATSATTMVPPPASSLSPPLSGPTPSVQPSVQHAQQSHHVLPTTANANVSQKHSPSSSLNLPTQNGNTSHTPSTLNGDSSYIHQQHQQQQTVHSQQPHHYHRHHHTSPSPVSTAKQQPPSPPPIAAATNHQHPSSQSAVINQQQQQQQQHQPQKSMQQPSQTVPPNSGMSAASAYTTSPPQVMPGTIDTVHSDSSSSFTSHLSPPNFADLSDAWDMVIPNEFSSYCPPQSGMTQQTAPLFVPNMSYATQDYHSLQPSNQQVLLPANMPIAQQQPQSQQYQLSQQQQQQQQQQEQQHGYPTNQAALYRPRHNDSYVSSAIVPDFNLENVLCKQNQTGGDVMDNNLFKTYPLLVPALMSIVIGHTMSMSTDDLLSHTRLLSTPHHQQQKQQHRRLAPTAMLHPFDGDHQQCLYFGNSKMMMMTPGLRSTQSHSRTSPGPYPLSKKQVHAMWENLLDQMVKTKSKQRYRQQQQQQSSSLSETTNDNCITATTTTTTKASKAETRREIESEIAQEMIMTTMKWNSEHSNSSIDGDYDDYYDDEEDDEEPWYDMPVTGFKAICPLYWMQRQFCRFVITYVVVKYPHLEDPCKTYLPICEQFRRRAITN